MYILYYVIAESLQIMYIQQHTQPDKTRATLTTASRAQTERSTIYSTHEKFSGFIVYTPTACSGKHMCVCRFSKRHSCLSTQVPSLKGLN